MALRRRSWRGWLEAPVWCLEADLAWLINSFHCSQAVCDRCSGPNLWPGPPEPKSCLFYWSSCLSPHPCFLLGALGVRLRSPLAQIKCLWLISLGCYYQQRWKPLAVHSDLGNTGSLLALPVKQCRISCFSVWPWTFNRTQRLTQSLHSNQSHTSPLVAVTLNAS